jgi:hypothetical protein
MDRPIGRKRRERRWGHEAEAKVRAVLKLVGGCDTIRVAGTRDGYCRRRDGRGGTRDDGWRARGSGTGNGNTSH